MNAYILSIETIRTIRRIQKLRRKGYEYKQIDEFLGLEGPDGDSFSYHLMREVRRSKKQLVRA